MNRTPVESSQITSIGYDAATKKLEIEFRSFKPGFSGSVYEYDNVPPETHAALISAESIGKQFGATIKGQFEYRRVADPKPLGEGVAA